jgi:hypothetical protein
VLTGFKARVEGRIGIVTALHGIVGCRDLMAFNLRHTYRSLRVSRVDLAHDVALLSSADLERETDALQTLAAFRDEQLRVIGYPQALQYQFSHRIEPHIPPFRRLYELLPASERGELQNRRSPSTRETVMSLSGAIQSGYSGAPVVTWQGSVIAIANGGLRGGGADIGWAMPIWQVKWEDPIKPQVEAELRRLAGGTLGALFGAEAKPVSTLRVLYLADGGDPVGKIYELREGQLRVLYQRPQGRIYSVATAPDGDIYFSDHNGNHIYRLQGGKEVSVYTHKTYTRGIGFDREGRLHFAEATGAGADGTIYVLDLSARAALPRFKVRLSEIDGSWAGNFAFAPDGTLWLSSGNRVPASLYKMTGDRIQRMFTSADSITGLAFTSEGDILYADWRQRLYRIELPGFITSVVTHAQELKWVSDVAVQAPQRAIRRLRPGGIR